MAKAKAKAKDEDFDHLNFFIAVSDLTESTDKITVLDATGVVSWFDKRGLDDPFEANFGKEYGLPPNVTLDDVEKGIAWIEDGYRGDIVYNAILKIHGRWLFILTMDGMVDLVPGFRFDRFLKRVEKAIARVENDDGEDDSGGDEEL